MTPIVFSTDEDVEHLYRGLVALIKSNVGYGFCNGDQGHPVYAFGSKGEPWTLDKDIPDDEESNRLFIILKELSGWIKESGLHDATWFTDLSTWQAFCKLVFVSSGCARQE